MFSIVILLNRVALFFVYCMFALPCSDGKLTLNFFVSTCFSSMTSVLFGVLLVEAEGSFSNFLLLIYSIFWQCLFIFPFGGDSGPFELGVLYIVWI